ncbi:MAG: Hpt domain-containing protein [Desulfovibrionaceae bacterium]
MTVPRDEDWLSFASGVDVPQALANMRGKAPLLQEVARTFIEDAPVQLNKLKEGLASGDADLTANSAHAMKSSLELLAAPRAHALAYQVELAGKTGDMERAARLNAELSAELNKVFEDLAAIVADS